MMFPFFKKCSRTKAFVNDVHYEDKNVDDYDGIVVVKVVMAVVVDNVAYLETIRNRAFSKTCRVCLDDNQQKPNE